MQVAGNQPLTQPLLMQRDDLLITGQAVGTADLPTPLGSSERARLRGA